MADILNQKEDVLSIELTSHGRQMLGLGFFQPRYFAFYDDTVLYDASYSGVSEEINNIQKRILDESLTLKSLSLTEDYLRDMLGSSDSVNEFAPAWSLKVLNGTINYLQDKSSYYRKRFNINDITYRITYNEDDLNALPDITDDYLLIDLQELNMSDDISNYEIEVFTYDEASGGKSVGLERKLLFNQKKTNIINDILYEDSELPSNYFSANASNEDVSYYYDILVDDEIDTDFILQKQKVIKIAGTYQSDYTGPIDPKC